MAKILVIQHSAADSPAAADEILQRTEHQVETVRIDKNDLIPRSVDADVLMTFGGAMSLAKDTPPPWVLEEQRLIRDYVDRGRRVLGICLGSQIIARALGGEVRRNPEPEIGWHPVEPVAASGSPMTDDLFAQPLTALQWHRDTFEIPTGRRHLLRSAACENQGFVIDDRVFAFQFHLEANARTVDIFLTVSKLWKQQAPFVQSEAEIVRGKSLHLPRQTEVLHQFLERFLA